MMKQVHKKHPGGSSPNVAHSSSSLTTGTRAAYPFAFVNISQPGEYSAVYRDPVGIPDKTGSGESLTIDKSACRNSG
jgi:hypothetical protein